jgi:hypothetical protein
MLQFPFRCRKPPTYFAQRLRAAQLTKQHGHELPPTAETSCVSLRFVLAHGGFKFQARKKLENLRKYAAESIQG